MALTEELGGVTNQIRAIDPGPRPASFLATAANLGSRAVDTWENINQRRAANRANAEQEAERQTQTNLAQAFLADQYNQAGTAKENIPEGLRSRVVGLRRLQTGVEQGRIDPSRLQTAVEAEISRLQAESPERLPGALTYLRQEGFDHLLLREARNAEATQSAMEAADRELAVSRFNAGAEVLGDLTEGTPQEEIIRIGAERLAASAQLADTLEQVRGQEELDEVARNNLNRQVYAAAMTDIHARIYPSVGQVMTRLQMGEVTGDAARVEWGQLRRMIEGDRSQVLSELARQGVDRDTLNDIRDEYGRIIEDLNTAFTDDTARTVLDRFSSELGLNFAQAFPMVATIRSVGGESAVSDFLEASAVAAGLEADLRSSLTQYFADQNVAMDAVRTITERPGTPAARDAEGRIIRNSGDDATIETARPEDIQAGWGQVYLNRLAIATANVLRATSPTGVGEALGAVGRGVEGAIGGMERSLSDASGIERVRARRYSGVAPREAMRAAESGDFARFAMHYGATLNYTANNEIGAVGQASGETLANASSVLFNSAAAAALETTGDTDLVQQANDVALQLIDRVPNYVSGAGVRQAIAGDEIRFDASQGRFVLFSEQHAFRRGSWYTDTSQANRFSDNATNPDMRRAVEAGNRALDFLVRTQPLDPRLNIDGANELQMRTFFATGQRPQTDTGEKSRTKTSPSFAERMEFELVAQASEPVDMNAYLDRLAFVESSNRPTAQASTSSAAGLFQFTEDTWRDSARLVPELRARMNDDDFMDLRFDPELSRQVVEATTASNAELLRSVLDREPTAGELYAAHFLGRRGSLQLVSSPPDRPAEEVFPRPARANRNVFYKPDGTPRTIAELRDWLEQRMRA
jgi:hypothetical protein